CPSGVKYDALLEQTRAELEVASPRPRRECLFRGLLFALLPHPARLRVLALLIWVYQRLGLARLLRRLRLIPRRLLDLEALAPSVRLGRARSWRPPAGRPAGSRPRARVGLVAGCVQRVFFPEVNDATVRVLLAEGCEVTVPAGQGCCGALSLHAG